MPYKISKITDKVTDGNKLIAEFMGAKYIPDGTSPIYQTPSPTFDFEDKRPSRHASRYWIDLEYHISWDWLMPAWEKFYQEVVLDQDKDYTAEYGKDLECMEYSLSSANIEGAFKHFVNLLKWYNQNKNL